MLVDFSWGTGKLCDLPFLGSRRVLQPHMLSGLSKYCDPLSSSSQQSSRRVLHPNSSTCATRLCGEYSSGIHQSFCFQGVSQLIERFQLMPPDQQINLLILSRCFQTAIFSQGLKVSRTECEPSKRRNSVSYSTLGLPDSSPVDFLSQILWELSLWCRSQG